MFAQGTGPGDLALAALSVGTLPTIFAWNNNTSTTGSDNGPSPDAIDAQTSAGYGDVFHGEATAATGTSPTCQNNCTDLRSRRRRMQPRELRICFMATQAARTPTAFNSTSVPR